MPAALGVSHQRLQRKRRRHHMSRGAAGTSRSLAAEPAAIAAARASLAAKPIATIQRGKLPKITDLTNPIDRKRAEKIASRLIGEEPITSETPLIKRPLARKDATAHVSDVIVSPTW